MACGIGEEEVRKKMNFWVSKGVVAVTTGTAVSAGVGIGVGGGEESVVYVVVEKQAERAAADSGEPQRAQEFDADDDDLEVRFTVAGQSIYSFHLIIPSCTIFVFLTRATNYCIFGWNSSQCPSRMSARRPCWRPSRYT